MKEKRITWLILAFAIIMGMTALGLPEEGLGLASPILVFVFVEAVWKL